MYPGQPAGVAERPMDRQPKVGGSTKRSAAPALRRTGGVLTAASYSKWRQPGSQSKGGGGRGDSAGGCAGWRINSRLRTGHRRCSAPSCASLVRAGRRDRRVGLARRDLAAYNVQGAARMRETRSFRLARPAISILALTLSLLATSARAQECCLVGGHKLTARQAGYVHTLASLIAQELPGSRAERATTLAYVTWWALREGILSLQQPHRFSSCTASLPSGCCTDIHVDFLGICEPLPATLTPKSCPVQHKKNERPCSTQWTNQVIWQVGMLGVQVTNYSDQQVMRAIASLSSNQTEATILAQVVGPDFANITDEKTREAILASTGELRRSWLLRNPAVSAMLLVPTVKRCFLEQTSKQQRIPNWCITEGNPFASSPTQAEQSLRDLKNAFEQFVAE